MTYLYNTPGVEEDTPDLPAHHDTLIRQAKDVIGTLAAERLQSR
ncbi:hypothetical protein [Enterobacillus tribolii]|nr:hypothetical protein [Enterobacillus tribolii]